MKIDGFSYAHIEWKFVHLLQIIWYAIQLFNP